MLLWVNSPGIHCCLVLTALVSNAAVLCGPRLAPAGYVDGSTWPSLVYYDHLQQQTRLSICKATGSSVHRNVRLAGKRELRISVYVEKYF